jgi:hypothetical protein
VLHSVYQEGGSVAGAKVVGASLCIFVTSGMENRNEAVA